MKKTSISFGLVNILVNIDPVIKNNDTKFNQLHKKCGSRIKYLKYCPVCKKEVTQSDIIKGYEYEKGEYVTLTTEEIASLNSDAEKIIEVIGFVSLSEIDPVYFEKSYVVSSVKNKAYTLFKDALKKTKKVALAKTVIGTKFYYVILRLSNNVVIMDTLYFLEEINIPIIDSQMSYTAKELDLAIKLVDAMSIDFNPQDLKDEYQIKVKKAINDKIKGKSIRGSKKKKDKSIKDLMTALEMSLKNV